MLVQSWLQVPYTEHSSKSVRGEKDKRIIIQRSKGALRHHLLKGSLVESTALGCANLLARKQFWDLLCSITLLLSVRLENISWKTGEVGTADTTVNLTTELRYHPHETYILVVKGKADVIIKETQGKAWARSGRPVL